MLGKVWFTQKKFLSSIMGLCLAKIKARHKGVGIALKNVSWASHFWYYIFMKSSLMADILNRSNFYLTFSFYLRIRFCDFFLFVWWTEEVPYWFFIIWPTILFLLFRMKTICVSRTNVEVLLQFSRLLDYWPPRLLSMALSAMFQLNQLQEDISYPRF